MFIERGACFDYISEIERWRLMDGGRRSDDVRVKTGEAVLIRVPKMKKRRSAKDEPLTADRAWIDGRTPYYARSAKIGATISLLIRRARIESRQRRAEDKQKQSPALRTKSRLAIMLRRDMPRSYFSGEKICPLSGARYAALSLGFIAVKAPF